MVIPSSYTIETNRLRLRYPLLSDLKTIFEASQTKGFNDGMRWNPPATVEELMPMHQKFVDHWKNGKSYVFSIDMRESGAFVGRIGLHFREKKEWEIGFMVFPKYQNQAIISEATMAIIDLAFTKLNAPKLVISHTPENLSSKRVIEKCGFHYSHTTPKAFEKNGKWLKEVVYYLENAE